VRRREGPLIRSKKLHIHEYTGHNPDTVPEMQEDLPQLQEAYTDFKGDKRGCHQQSNSRCKGGRMRKERGFSYSLFG